jgi:hypothetical protein
MFQFSVTPFRASQRRFSLYCGAALITLATVSQTHAQSAPKETPLSVVNALHAAFGQHHDRAVHTKGTISATSMAAAGPSALKLPPPVKSFNWPMSALGQKQTSQRISRMSALPPKADIGTQPRNAFFS